MNTIWPVGSGERTGPGSGQYTVRRPVLDLSSANGCVTLPVCAHPQKATYGGTGPATAAASYACA